MRADHVLLRLNLSADIYALQAELRWTDHAHEMISWLQGRDAIWSSESERSGSAAQCAREDARTKLFERMLDGREDRPRDLRLEEDRRAEPAPPRGLPALPGGVRPALDRVSLDLAPGQIVGLYGPSGAGKTTMLQIAAGRVAPGGGEVPYNGRA